MQLQGQRERVRGRQGGEHKGRSVLIHLSKEPEGIYRGAGAEPKGNRNLSLILILVLILVLVLIGRDHTLLTLIIVRDGLGNTILLGSV
jgi:hypothetical protein